MMELNVTGLPRIVGHDTPGDAIHAAPSGELLAELLSDPPMTESIAFSESEFAIHLSGENTLRLKIEADETVSVEQQRGWIATPPPSLPDVIRLRYPSGNVSEWDRAADAALLVKRRLIRVFANPPFVFVYPEAAPILLFAAIRTSWSDEPLLTWEESD